MGSRKKKEVSVLLWKTGIFLQLAPTEPGSGAKQGRRFLFGVTLLESFHLKLLTFFSRVNPDSVSKHATVSASHVTSGIDQRFQNRQRVTLHLTCTA